MDKAEKTGARMPVWLRIVLGLSLGMNLLILGLVGGVMLRFGGPEGMRPPPQSVGIALFRALPGEDRRALRERSIGMAMGSGMSMKEMQNGPHVRQMAQAKAVSAALRATPFDREALSAILDGQVARRLGYQKSMQQAWLERVAEMSAADRQAYAARLEHAMNRSRNRDRRGKSRGD